MKERIYVVEKNQNEAKMSERTSCKNISTANERKMDFEAVHIYVYVYLLTASSTTITKENSRELFSRRR